ncbi:MAG TPA: DUF302 domain-containing protein [Reyranella sp.]
MSAQGLRVLPSRHGAVETLERLEAIIVRQGMTVVARIDHGAAAEKVGLDLRPTVVVFFGNPRAGTPAMQATPTIAIDLPLRMLIWQDEKGTWLGYNDPKWLAKRHDALVGTDRALGAMTDVLAVVAKEATEA